MKIAITVTLAAMTALTATTAAAADSLLVTASTGSSRVSLDQRATDACVGAFLARLLPGSSGRVRTVMPAGSSGIFTSVAADPQLAPYRLMEVQMTASKARGGELLARSYCRVDRNARVLQLDTHVMDEATLRGLTVKDIHFAMASD